MARADLISDLVAFGMTGDRARFRKAVEALIAEERAMKHTVLAEKLAELIQFTAQETPRINGSVGIEQKSIGFVHEIIPKRRLDDLVLSKDILDIVREVVSEHHRADLLRSYNLEPRNRFLLIGPPGNGKTSLAEAIAESMIVPLLQVRYDGIIGAYLGETAVRLRKLLDYASTRQCVLFFDEFETLGKERGDTHETGEIKRVVSSLLMQLDSLPSHVVVIGATNHPELLDRAVWRRFQVRLEIPKPTAARLVEWLSKFEKRINLQLGYSHESLAKKLHGFNFAEIEEFGTSVFRRYVLALPESNVKKIVDDTLKSWKTRSAKSIESNGADHE